MNSTGLTEGQLFTIEALNRIDGFVWPDDMNYACTPKRGGFIWFLQYEPLLQNDGFDIPHGWAVKRGIGIRHPDWRNSLITREQFDSADGWVRVDKDSLPIINAEVAIDIKCFPDGDGFQSGSLAKFIKWDDVKLWRYHKPTKENEMQQPKPFKKRECIETLIDKRKDAIEQKRLALAALEEAEAKERELMLSIQAWAESYGFDIRVLDESDEVQEAELEPDPELVILARFSGLGCY